MGKKAVIYTIVILIFAIGVFSFLNRAGKDIEPETIKIFKKGHPVYEITMDEVKSLPRVEKETVLNSSQGREEHFFTGTPLREVIMKADTDLLDEAKQVVAKGIDGYTVSFDVQEVLQKEKVLLVYAQDGKPLGSKSTGGTGPFRIIAPNDQFAQRAAKYIQELEVR